MLGHIEERNEVRQNIFLPDKIMIFQTSYLCQLLSCADAILTVSDVDCQIIRNSLFKVGISVLALSQDQKLKDEARGKIDA